MTKPVKVFTARVTDEYGGVFENALVAVRKFSESSHNTFESDDCATPYKTESIIDGLTYCANYWYSAQTKQQGVRSRPLLIDEGESFSSVIVADIESEEAVRIINGAGDEVDKYLRVIEADFRSRFK